jgi:hypothetical protein
MRKRDTIHMTTIPPDTPEVSEAVTNRTSLLAEDQYITMSFLYTHSTIREVVDCLVKMNTRTLLRNSLSKAVYCNFLTLWITLKFTISPCAHGKTSIFKS